VPWRIINTTDNQHVGEVLEHIEKGQIITFPDGDVVAVERIFMDAEGDSMVAFGTNYQMTLVKE
jgi:Holliday junction resolvasome RuvABC endonuclease subunit